MKKIAIYLVGRPSNGGSYQYWIAVLKALAQIDREKYQVIVYSQFEDWKVIADKLELNFHLAYKHLNYLQKICMHVLPSVLPTKIIKKCSALWDPFVKALKKECPDLWIGQTTAIGKDILDIPTIIPIFDLMHRYCQGIPELQEKFEEREILYTHQCKQATMILVDSEVGKQHVVECYGNVTKGLADKIRILPFIPPDYIYDEQRELTFPYEIFDKFIFYPAQFWTHKNHKRLLEAINQLKDKNVIVNLVLVGSEQNNERAVSELIKDYKLENQVKILGYVNNREMVYLYRHARALVMPTLFGPTNIPQLEAFVLQCPVATSRIYGIPDQVGDAALLFDPQNVDEIADCIEKLWKDDVLCDSFREKGTRKALQWGQKEFSDKLLEYIGEIT